MKIAKLKLSLIFGILLFLACGEAPLVIQGTVVAYDENSHQLVVKDELPPQDILVFSLENAEMGATPMEGDTVRIAYHQSEGTLKAVRVMDITRQSELKKGH